MLGEVLVVRGQMQWLRPPLQGINLDMQGIDPRNELDLHLLMKLLPLLPLLLVLLQLDQLNDMELKVMLPLMAMMLKRVLQ